MKNKKILVAGVSSAILFGFAYGEYSKDLNNVAYAVEKNETLDVKNLPNGTYTLDFKIKNAGNKEKLSMADGAVSKPARLIVKDGEYRVQLNFKALTFSGQTGYLGNLAYYDNGELVQANILSWYSESEKDASFDVYKEAYPERNAYPKLIEYPINKENIVANKLETKVGVYVPVMASISQAIGEQDALPVFDFDTLTVVSLEEKVTTKKEEVKSSEEKETAKENNLQENKKEVATKPEDKKVDSGNVKESKTELPKVENKKEVSNSQKEVATKSEDKKENNIKEIENKNVVYNKDTNKNVVQNNKNVNLANFKNLPDGNYSLGFSIHNANNPSQLSMANGAVIKPARLLVRGGNYRVEITFQALNFMNQRGYLGNLGYYAKDGSVRQASIESYYSPEEVDNFFNIYKQAYPNRNAYPKTVSFPLNKDAIQNDGMLSARVQVYVPVMASISQAVGTQDALPIFNFKNISVLGLTHTEEQGKNNILPEDKLVETPIMSNEELLNSNNKRSSSYKGGQIFSLDNSTKKGTRTSSFSKNSKLSKTGLDTLATTYFGLLFIGLAFLLGYKKKESK